MSASRKVWISGAAGLLVLLSNIGCVSSSSKPSLSVDAQAEALSHFSFGLLAEASGDSVTALRELEAAIRLDPAETTLYPPAAAVALKLDRPDDALRMARQLEKEQPGTLASLLLLARIYTFTGQPGEAEVFFRQAEAGFPKNPEAQLSLARFFLSQEKPEKAIQTLEAAIEQQNRSAKIFHLLGTLYFEKSRRQTDPQLFRMMTLAGIGFLEKSLEIDPSDPIKRQQIGYAYLSIKQPEAALSALEKARVSLSTDLMLARQVLELSIQIKPIQETIELCEKLAGQTKMERELWFQVLVEQALTEHRAALIEYFEEQLLRKKPPIFYFAQLSSLYLDDERYADAEATLLRAIELHPADTRLQTVLGYLHLRQEKYEEAYSAFDRVRTDPENAAWTQNPFFALNFMVAAQKTDRLEEAVSTLASTHTNNPAVLNQYMHSLLTGESPVSAVAAIDLLESFHRLSPETIEVLYYLTLLQTEEGEYAEALKTAQQFEMLAQTRENTDILDASFYYQYATLHERTGRFDEAENFFFKAIEMGDPPTIASAQNYIAYMWAEQGEKLELGLTLIEKALTAEPDNPAFMDTLGWIYYMQGRYKEALHLLKTAGNLLNEDPVIWEHLGDTYLKLGNPAAARKHWEKALELSPGAEHLNERIKENTP